MSEANNVFYYDRNFTCLKTPLLNVTLFEISLFRKSSLYDTRHKIHTKLKCLVTFELKFITHSLTFGFFFADFITTLMYFLNVSCEENTPPVIFWTKECYEVSIDLSPGILTLYLSASFTSFFTKFYYIN